MYKKISNLNAPAMNSIQYNSNRRGCSKTRKFISVYIALNKEATWWLIVS